MTGLFDLLLVEFLSAHRFIDRESIDRDFEMNKKRVNIVAILNSANWQIIVDGSGG